MSLVVQNQYQHIASVGSVLHANFNEIGYKNFEIQLSKRSCHRPKEFVVSERDMKLILENIEQSQEIGNEQYINNLPILAQAEFYHNAECGDVMRTDFLAYQGGDLNDFFRETTKPQRVSEICLVNDHFILVKMPETCWRRNSQIECILEEQNMVKDNVPVPNNKLETEDNVARMDEATCHSKLSRYFMCNRNRKISPIHEECNCKNDVPQHVANTHDTQEKQEVFQTQTKIQRGRKSIEVKPLKSVNDNKENAPLDLSTRHFNNKHEDEIHITTQEETNQTPQITLPTQRNQLLKSSLHNIVSLQHHGSLATPIETIQNDKLVEVYEIPENAVSAHKKHVKKRSNAFNWFLKPFRWRPSTANQRAKKSKQKIHAVIYKTYFVSWTKVPENNDNVTALRQRQITLNQMNENMKCDLPKLRRSRSAIF